MTKSGKSTSGHKGFWTPARLVATFFVLALVTAFWLPGCTQPTEVAKPNTKNSAPTTASNPPAEPVRAVPLAPSVLNMELKDIDGKGFKLSDYAGKVVVVNLWATWCGPCRVEIPELIKLGDEYKARGVELIGVTTEDPLEDEAKVKDFVAKQNINYRVAWNSNGFATGMMQGNVQNSIPQSFVVTRDGAVIAHLTGFSPTSTPPRLRAAVEQALNYKG